jgi:outer membrane biosynthesis protein TonB
MKKYQAGGGIREGRARFGDDVRERAREEMARRAAGVEAMPVKPPVSTKPKAAAKPAPKAQPKAEPKAEPKVEVKTEPKPEPKVEAKPERKAGQFGPRTTFPRDVGTDAAAKARRKMFGDDKKEEPGKSSGGLREFFRTLYQDREGKKAGGTVKKAKGGSVAKRGDGIAKKGRTKGRFV